MWRELINKRMKVTSVQRNIKEIIRELKDRAERRRVEESAKDRGAGQRK
ncbi:unnamed protein product, partial [Didymodactylos carnosus]